MITRVDPARRRPAPDRRHRALRRRRVQPGHRGPGDRGQTGRARVTAARKSLMIGLRSLSTQLSGAQVGITVTTLALGFVMQPALADLVAVPLEAIGLSTGAAEIGRPAVRTDRRDGAVHGVRRAGAQEHRHRRAAGHREDRDHPDAGVDDAVQAADRGAERHRERRAADDRRRAAGGTALGALRGRAATPWSAGRPRRAPWSSRPRACSPGPSRSPARPPTTCSPRGCGCGSSRPPTPRTRVLAVAAVETGHSRFPVSGEDSDDVVGLVHLKRAVAIPPDERAGRAGRAADGAGAGRARARCRWTTCSTSCAHAACRWPSSPTSTAAPPASSPSRTSSRNWSARSRTSTTRSDSRAECRADDTWLLPGTLRPGRDRRDHRGAAARVQRLRDRGRPADRPAGPDAGGIRLRRGGRDHGRLGAPGDPGRAGRSTPTTAGSRRRPRTICRVR